MLESLRNPKLIRLSLTAHSRYGLIYANHCPLGSLGVGVCPSRFGRSESFSPIVILLNTHIVYINLSVFFGFWCDKKVIYCGNLYTGMVFMPKNPVGIIPNRLLFFDTFIKGFQKNYHTSI